MSVLQVVRPPVAIFHLIIFWLLYLCSEEMKVVFRHISMISFKVLSNFIFHPNTNTFPSHDRTGSPRGSPCWWASPFCCCPCRHTDDLLRPLAHRQEPLESRKISSWLQQSSYLSLFSWIMFWGMTVLHFYGFVFRQNKPLLYELIFQSGTE